MAKKMKKKKGCGGSTKREKNINNKILERKFSSENKRDVRSMILKVSQVFFFCSRGILCGSMLPHPLHFYRTPDGTPPLPLLPQMEPPPPCSPRWNPPPQPARPLLLQMEPPPLVIIFLFLSFSFSCFFKILIPQSS